MADWQQRGRRFANSLKGRPRAMRHRVKLFFRGQWMYLVHVLALLAPGRKVPVVRAHPIPAQDLTDWNEDELKLMVEEGRRQGDRQVATLEQIRGRAQWLFTFGAPLVVVVASVMAEIDKKDSDWWTLIWLLSLLAAGYGVLGAAAIMTVRADLNIIDSAVLSRKRRPILKALAADYASMMRDGENTVATRLTVFWQAVVWVILGGYGALIAWLAVR